MRKYIGGIVLIFMALSCHDDREEPRRIEDVRFYPLRTRDFKVYDVEEIRYTLSTPETIRYHLKHVTSDSFGNSAGGLTYIIQQYTRQTDQQPWTAGTPITVRRDMNQVVVTEDNIPIVALSFPATTGTTWDGNAYNNTVSPFTGEARDEYTIIEEGKTVTVGTKTYTNCITVEQEDDEDVILYADFRSEIYSPDIGLVIKERTQLRYCNNEGRGCIGQQLVDEGIILRQRLIEHGRE